MQNGAQLFSAASLPQSFHPWCHSSRKRLFDFVCATFLFALLLPIILLLVVIVKATSRGPVFFRQKRIGRNGREFELVKFRSMEHHRRESGPGLTHKGDARITAWGRILRRWKLDELPQLWNVIRGDMSLVGPRPDLAEYLVALDPHQRQIVRLKPGITGAATLRFRNEENLFAEVPHSQIRQFYVNRILPEKVQIDLDYARNATFFTDVAVLWRTAAAILR